MKERPILFKGEMVRAILDGRKTQTRRIAKEFDDSHSGILERFPNQTGCKHGNPGDRLWVKETFGARDTGTGFTDVVFRADTEDAKPWRNPNAGWRPSIFMPRAVSRITLEIVSVRVERLNDISEEDAKAEGVEGVRVGFLDGRMGGKCSEVSYVEEYGELWESINGHGSWALNPWVWVIEFKNITTK